MNNNECDRRYRCFDGGFVKIDYCFAIRDGRTEKTEVGKQLDYEEKLRLDGLKRSSEGEGSPSTDER